MMIFLQPKSLDEALEMLNTHENLKILAGGTDLIIALRENWITCDYLMDCKKIPELSKIEMDDEGLSIGAAVTCTQILESDLVTDEYDVLKQGSAQLANILLRNRATMVGNICNASPGGDLISPALVLDGILVANSVDGERRIPLKDFFTGPKKHVLKENELVSRIVFPKKAGEGIFLKKQRIKGHDLAQVGVSGFLAEDGKFSLGLCAVGPTPVFLDDFGSLSKDELFNKKDEIAQKALEAISPISDTRSSKEYRIAMTEYFVTNIIDRLAGRAEVSA